MTRLVTRITEFLADGIISEAAEDYLKLSIFKKASRMISNMKRVQFRSDPGLPLHYSED